MLTAAQSKGKNSPLHSHKMHHRLAKMQHTISGELTNDAASAMNAA
jgi:hypothetical protein